MEVSGMNENSSIAAPAGILNPPTKNMKAYAYNAIRYGQFFGYRVLARALLEAS